MEREWVRDGWRGSRCERDADGVGERDGERVGEGSEARRGGGRSCHLAPPYRSYGLRVGC